MVVVVAAILVDDLAAPTRLLAARRIGPTTLAGRWEFPGGKVEPGEQPVAALHRELAEEVGVRVALGPEVVSPAGAAWPIADEGLMRVWLAQIIAGQLRPTGSHDLLRWLGSEDLFDVDWLDPDVPLVEACRGILRPGLAG